MSLTPAPVYVSNINAGTATASYSYPGDANHEGSDDTEDFTIGKATQVITWNPPVAITYGTVLSAAHLNATVVGVTGGSAPGALTYNPPIGTMLTPATQTLRVDAAETSNYNAAFKVVNLIVNCVTVNASENSTPQAVSTTVKTTVKILVKDATTGTIAIGTPVTLYFENRPAITVNSGSDGIARFDVGILAADVYKVKAVVDGCGGEDIAYLPIYDPNGGFVTGGGWFMSPVDPLSKYEYMTKGGKANFGFVAKYKKGSNDQVDGNTEFQFQAGNLDFKSSSHTAMSLVVAGPKAIYKGQGSINGVSGYSFMVSGLDGDLKTPKEADKFRIKIWKTTGGGVVYDNQLGADENMEATTILGGGSIVIHQVKGKTQKAEEAQMVATPQLTLANKLSLKAYPNPAVSHFNISLESNNTRDAITLKVYNQLGQVVDVKRNLFSGQVVQVGGAYKQGTYFLEVTQGEQKQNLQVVKSN